MLALEPIEMAAVQEQHRGQSSLHRSRDHAHLCASADPEEPNLSHLSDPSEGQPSRLPLGVEQSTASDHEKLTPPSDGQPEQGPEYQRWQIPVAVESHRAPQEIT